MSISPPDGSLNIPLNDVFVGLKRKQIVKDASIYEKTTQQVDLEKRYNNKKIYKRTLLPILWSPEMSLLLPSPEKLHIQNI